MRQKMYSAITILGLATGLGVFILFWIISDVAFTTDTFHDNADRLFGVVQVHSSGREGEQHTAITPAPLLDAVLREIPQIEDGVRFFRAERMIVRHNGENFYEDDVLFGDPNFFSVFSFRTVVGDPAVVLARPNSIVLTEESALKYFGNENPIGKSLTLNNQIDMIVTGIAEEAPLNSSITYDFVISMETARQLYDWMDEWKVNSQATFLLLPKKHSLEALEDKLSLLIDKYYSDAPESPRRMYLFPLKSFFLKSIGIDSFMHRNFGIVYYLLLASGIILLIVVSLNFMSLSTARYTTRIKEVGVRKVVGANRSHLITQFISESVLMALLALPLGMWLFHLMIRVLASYLGRTTPVSILGNPLQLIVLLLITILIGLFAGSYPAFFLSSFRPGAMLKENLVSGKMGARFRKVLVVSQFAFSIVLIVFAIVVNRQFNHILTVDLGYSRESIVALPLSGESRDRLDLMRMEALKHPDVVSVSASASLPCAWNSERQVRHEGMDENEAWTMNVYGIDYGFVELFDMDVTLGRSFSREFRDRNHFLINETAARQLEWNEPIGKWMKIGEREGSVIGVVKDFLFKDVHFPILPSVLLLEPENRNYMLVKYSSAESLPIVVDHLKQTWKGLVPHLPFEYTTHEDYFHDIYRGINTIAMLCGGVGILGIFLSCLGILGLSTYTVERRTKEVGIRKVLGASVSTIIVLLAKNFLILVVLANVIGLPIAYFLSNSFLAWGMPAYRIDLGGWMFLVTFFMTFTMAVFAIIFQTLKAARSNPVDALRYE
jgi:ABC-type antimicrobial peptide transport system permease subunit